MKRQQQTCFIEMTISRPEFEAEVEIVGEVTPGYAGNTSGPPDSWCMPDPWEVEITAVRVIEATDNNGEPIKGATVTLTADETERAEDRLCEAYDESEGRYDI
jgi:hypothetical protein